MISVIIPVYNIPTKYLEECLDSIILQTYKDLEIIIVNDDSPILDNNITIQKFKSIDNRIVYISLNKNGGVSNARNLAMNIATGDWVTFVDADDKLKTDALELMLKAAIKNDASIVVCNIQFDQDVDASNFIVSQNKRKVSQIHANESSILEAINDFQMSFVGKLYKRNVLRDIYFPVGIAHFEDYTLLWKLACKEIKYVMIENIGYEACWREGSATRTRVDVQKCERILHALCFCCDQIAMYFDKYPKIKYYLTLFVIRESFAYKYMFLYLNKFERRMVAKSARLLYYKLKTIGMLPCSLKPVINIRLFLLDKGLGLNRLVYLFSKIIYRLNCL